MTLTEIVSNKSARECKTLLLEIAEAFENYPSYLSYGSDYARGYKDGIYLQYDWIHEKISKE